MTSWQDMSLEDARAYDERKESGSFRHHVQVKRRILWDLISEYLPDDRSAPILDLGGGTGVWAIPLAQAGYQVRLTDISSGFLARAREKVDQLNLGSRITVEKADICDLNRYEDDSFPLILALGDPLSYCDDISKALHGIRRLLRQGGTLIGDVENAYGGIDRRRAASWEDIRRILHEGIAFWPGGTTAVKMLTPTRLRSLIESSGLKLKAMYPADIIGSLVEEELLHSTEGDIEQWVELEKRLRDDPSLLGCGREIQFVAGKGDRNG